jgi:hypothetical protein
MRFRVLALLASLVPFAACHVYDPALLDASRVDVATDARDAAVDARADVRDAVICDGAMCGDAGCVSLATDVHHCGACGRDCTALPGVTPSAVRCVAGMCDVTGACVPGRAHCSSNPMDGCEADVTTAMQCGACGAACAEPTPVCTMQPDDGGATWRCASGCEGMTPDWCGGTCVDQQTDVANCGACGNACPGGANARPGCADGSCRLNCNLGFGDCDGMVGNGCETNVLTSVMHCGRCGNACPAVMNGTPVCLLGTCSAICDAGFMLSDGQCLPPGLRPLAPLSTSTVTQRRPLFRWVLAAGTDGARVEICRDRACTMVLTTFDVTGSNGQPPSDLSPGISGVLFWRVRGRAGTTVVTAPGPTWQFALGVRSAPSANTFYGTDPDFDGDGYADVIVGASGTSRVHVYNGSATGTATTAQTLTAPAGATNFGAVVASAGDVNGDGYGDAIVSATGSSTVYVFHGGPTGLAATPATTLSPPPASSGFGAAIAAAGDTNGDGYADVIVGAPGSNTAYVFVGSATGLSTTPRTLSAPFGASSFGAAVAGAAEVNGDRYSDVLVGAPGSNRVLLYLGQLSTGIGVTPTQTIAGPVLRSSFGTSIGITDFNADGFTDVAVGMPTANTVHLYAGSTTGLATSSSQISPPGSASRFGHDVAGAGDVNRDGFGDLVVGANSSSQAFVYLGNGTALTFAQMLPGAPGSDFGGSVSGAGDVDRDGYADVAVGASGGNTAFVYRGGTTFPAGMTMLPAPAGASGFGISVASAAPLCQPRG